MRLKRVAGLLIVAVGLAVPAGANASGEIPEARFFLTPKSGKFYKNAFKTANWRVETGVTAPNPPNTEILPTRETTLRLPAAGQMTFNPPASMPVCPDTQIGPDTNNSAPIPTIVAKCPKSIIGNGTATFLLGRQNRPDLQTVQLKGQVIVFNGGRVSGQPRLKFWAYSYDTGVAIYTESTLSTDGVLSIPIPQLTQDSAVNSLNVNIPGKTESLFLENQGITVTLPGGQAPDYVRAKCDTGTFPFFADFLLGRRLTDGTPTGQAESFTNVGESISCTGTRATAKLGKVTVKGPAKAKRNKATTYSVTIRNSGGLNATGVRLAIAGRGLKLSSNVGTVAGEDSRTVKIKAKFKSAGKIKAKFNVSSKNGGKASATKTITVR